MSLFGAGKRLKIRLFWRLLLLCFGLIVGWSVWQFVIRPGAGFSWDEAAHSLKGLVIAHDLRSGNWLGFLYDTYRQVYWPPLHSCMTGIAFLCAGPSAAIARMVSLILFVLTAPIIYLAALQFQQRHREAAAAVATTLFLTSPLLISLSGLAMLEIPALFFLSLTILVYLWLNAAPRPATAWTWLGIAIAFTFLTRTNYGILLILVGLVSTCLGGGFRALVTRSNLYAILSLALIFVIWFAYPPKIRSTVAALVNIPWGMENPYSPSGFLFYPRVMLHLFGSMWQSVLPVAALIFAFRYWRNPGIRFLIVLILLQLGIGLVHHNRIDRHMIPVIPALALITGFVFAELWSIEADRIVSWSARLGALVLCLAGVGRLPLALHPPDVALHPEVASAITRKIEGSTLLLGAGEMRNPSPPVLDWELSVERGLLAAPRSGIAMNVDQDRKLWSMIRNRPLPLKSQIERILTRPEQPGNLRTLYLGVPPEADYSANPEKAAAFIRRMEAGSAFDTIIVATANIPNGSYPFELIDGMVRPLGFRHVDEEVFPKTKIRLELYRRTP